ncbi:MAG: DUF1440 domain-containing protein [Armatimonadota bacterium]|nr:DUF1440 domain-containing protein [Armatimonadota bacterium]
MDGRNEASAFKGLAAGAVGGLVASWVMEVFQGYWSAVSTARKEAEKNASQPGEQHDQSAAEEEQPAANETGSENDPSTVKAAAAVARILFGHELAPSEKATAGAAAHYVMGAASGGLYGVASELLPKTTAGAGIPFGAAVWMGADNVVLPLTGLAGPMTDYPISIHIYALASHLVYGACTDLVRRVVRQAL